MAQGNGIPMAMGLDLLWPINRVRLPDVLPKKTASKSPPLGGTILNVAW